MRFSIQVLLLSITTAAVAQVPVIISTGDQDAPLKNIPAASIGLIEGKASFEIDTGKPRAIQFQFPVEDGSLKMNCASTADLAKSSIVSSNQWYRIESPLKCSVQTRNHPLIQLRLLTKTAADVKNLKAVKPGNWEIAVSEGALDPRPSTIPLIFQPDFSASIPNISPLISESHALNQKLDSELNHFSILLGWMVVLALSAIFGIYQQFVTRKRLGRASVNPELYANLAKLSKNVESIINQQSMIQTKIQECVSREDMKELNAAISGQLANLAGRINSQETRKPFNDVAEPPMPEKKIVRVEPDGMIPETELRESPASRQLDKLLNTLTDLHFNGGGAGAGTVDGLDRSVSEFLRCSTPPKTELQGCLERIDGFVAALEKFMAHIEGSDGTLKLKHHLNEVRQLQAEIADLLSSTNTLNLRFEMSFYSSAANRDRLVDGIQATLKKQIWKMEKPVEYFEQQFKALTAATVQEATELLDGKLDVERMNEGAQELLRKLFQAGELEEIAPNPRDEFRSTEQERLNTFSRPSDLNHGPSIARVVTRGLRRGNNVLRKAAVTLYE